MSARKHLTMATLRNDGSPRISGTEVQFIGEQLEIGSMRGALKAIDLLRDPRIAIHGPTADPTKAGGWRGEAKLAGHAIPIPSEVDAHRFRIDVDEVVLTRLNTARDRLVIESWNPKRGYKMTERA